MPLYRFIDPAHAATAAAAAAGSLTALLVTRKYRGLQALTFFVIGQFTAFYFTVPLAMWFGFGDGALGWIGFTIGVVGMLFWAAVLSLVQNVVDDPKGTITWAWSLWKGKS